MAKSFFDEPHEPVNNINKGGSGSSNNRNPQSHNNSDNSHDKKGDTQKIRIDLKQNQNDKTPFNPVLNSKLFVSNPNQSNHTQKSYNIPPTQEDGFAQWLKKRMDKWN